MKKELSPSLEMVACDVCGRTILKGERTEPYLVPDGSRRLVCDLCVRRAESAGWLRESLHGDLPAATPRDEPRRSLLGRLRRRLEEGAVSSPAGHRGEPGESYAGAEWTRQPVPPRHEGVEEPSRGYEPVNRGFDGESGTAYADDLERADEVAYEEPAPSGGPPLLDEREPIDEAASAVDQPPAAWEERVSPEPQPAAEPQPAREQAAVEGRLRDEGTAELPPPLAEVPPEDPPLEGSLLREPASEEFALEGELPPESRDERRERRNRRRLRDPRHVRAVPTGAEAKVERALEIFNLSDYRRTVGGLVRTLGQPWVMALPHADSTSEVTVVVAWELSWYQFRVDLGDSDEPVAVADKGHELEEIDIDLRRWNATATDDGALETGAPPA